MLILQYPLLLLVAFLPLLLVKMKRQDLNQIKGLKLPFYEDLKSIKKMALYQPRQWLPKLLVIITWVLLVLALTGPQWVGEPIEMPKSGRDILLGIDISASMEVPDMKVGLNRVDRLTVVKYVANEFIKKRVGDRVGVILFGTKAYLQTPLTFDRKTVEYMVNDATTRLAGGATAIGDAIGLAVKRLKDLDSDSRVLILLTDGANNAGSLDPIVAAEMAAKRHIKIYTIGLGAQQIVVPGFFGSQIVNPSEDLDEDALKKIAKITNGEFFRATDPASLQDVYDKIDKLEPNAREKAVYRPSKDLYHWPLGVALILSLILMIRRIYTFERLGLG